MTEQQSGDVRALVEQIAKALVDAPETINQDPYGEGWICEMELAGDATPEGLLDAAAYAELTAG